MPKVSDDHLAARRSQILDGARRCFAEYGYDGATVRRLEEAIGLSRGAIFHHFRDKDALFFALANEDAERMADVAAEQGLVQVMRDMLAAPEQFNWLGTRLEIARRAAHRPRVPRGLDPALGRTDRGDPGPPRAPQSRRAACETMSADRCPARLPRSGPRRV